MSISTHVRHRLWLPITALALLLSTAFVWADGDELFEDNEVEAVTDDDDTTSDDDTTDDSSTTTSTAWTGNSVETVMLHNYAYATSDEEVADYADSATVYLYNVGTGLFVNQGGYWGTQPRLLSIGIPMSIDSTFTYNSKTQTQADTLVNTRKRENNETFKESTFYYINTGVNNNNTAGYLGYVTEDYAKGADESADSRSYDCFYLDRNGYDSEYTGDCSANFTRVTTYTDTVYSIRIASEDNNVDTWFYLTAVADETHGGYTVQPTTTYTSGNSDWILVTLADLVAAFNEADASAASPADATFMLKDQHFHRNNADYTAWTFTSSDDDYDSSSDTLVVKGRPDLYTYNVYNGIGYNYDNDEQQLEYGQYWIGNFYDVDNGSLTQSVDIVKQGWYRVSMKGFYLPSDTEREDKGSFVLILGADGSGSWDMKNYVKLEETDEEDIYYAESVEFNVSEASAYWFAVYDAEEDWSLNNGAGNLEHRYGGTQTSGSATITLGEKCTMYKNSCTSTDTVASSFAGANVTHGYYNVTVSLVEDDYYILIEEPLEEIYLVDGTATEWSDETVTTLTQTASGATTYSATITTTEANYTFAIYTQQDSDLGLTYRYAAESSAESTTLTTGTATTLYSNASYSTATTLTIAEAGTYTVTVTVTTDDDGNVTYTILLTEVIELPDGLLIVGGSDDWSLSSPLATLTKSSESTDDDGYTTYTYTASNVSLSPSDYFAVFSSAATALTDEGTRYGGYTSSESISAGTTASTLYNKDTSFQLSSEATSGATYTVTVTLTDKDGNGTILLTETEEAEKGTIYLWGAGDGSSTWAADTLTEATAGSKIYYSNGAIEFTTSDWLAVDTIGFSGDTWSPRFIVSSTYTPENTATLTKVTTTTSSFQVSTAGSYYVVVDMSSDTYTFLLTATNPQSNGDSSDEDSDSDSSISTPLYLWGYADSSTDKQVDWGEGSATLSWTSGTDSETGYYSAEAVYLAIPGTNWSGSYIVVSYDDKWSSSSTYYGPSGNSNTEISSGTAYDLTSSSPKNFTVPTTGYYTVKVTTSGNTAGDTPSTITFTGPNSTTTTGGTAKHRANEGISTADDDDDDSDDTTSSATMTATLSVTAGDGTDTNSTREVTLFEEGSTNFTEDEIDTPAGYLKAGQYLTDANTSTTYTTSAYVYVTVSGDDSKSITPTSLAISINVANGANGWVAFDDVELEYLGNADQYIVLDETDTSLGGGEGSSTLLLNDQLTNAIAYGKAKDRSENNVNFADSMINYTLILARPLTEGVWNSIVLPVDLTGSQVQTAFGGATRLAKFTSVYVGSSENQVINFTTIDLSTDGIENGQLYLIKPSSSEALYTPADGGATYVTPLPESSSTTTSYQRTVTSQYYLIPQVSFPRDTVTLTTPAYNADITGDTKDQRSDSTLTMKGTYIYQSKKVPTGSYVVGKTSDGTWGFYHYTGTSPLNIKGFRTWIEAAAATSSEEGTTEDVSSARLSFTIDGEYDESLGGYVPEDEDEATAISTVESDVVTANGTTATDNRVYSLSGQLLRSSGSLDGLAQGVYIVNGKKYIVK